MKMISSGSELITLLCTILGTGAYGMGDVTLGIGSGAVKTRFLDGSLLMTAKLLVTASGYKSRESLVNSLDAVGRNAAAYQSGEGVISITALTPPMMNLCSEKGYTSLSQEYEAVYLKGGDGS